MNDIIMNVQRFGSKVDLGFLTMIVIGELSMTFLGVCFNMGGWCRWGVRWS